MMEETLEQKFYKPGFMDLTSYKLQPATSGPEWDDFVESSDQGSIFCLTDYMQSVYDSRPKMWYCLKGSDPKAALVVMESDDGRRCIPVDHVIHTGIMLASPPTQSNAQTIAENFRVTSFIAAELAGRYDEVFISTHPNFSDVRPFLWHNYGEPGPKFNIDVRYTSMIRLDGMDPEDPVDRNPVYVSSSKSRRQEIRYGMQKGVKTSCESDVQTFLDFYVSTFEGQSQPLDEHEIRRLKGLVEGLLAAGRARMYVSRIASGDPGSVAVFGFDSKRAYYLFGANDPALRDQHTGTMVLWDAFLDLAASGVKEVDLEGVNSPLRGHFKLSFGGSITPYHHLRLQIK